MKKLLILVLTAVMIISLISCTKEEGKETFETSSYAPSERLETLKGLEALSDTIVYEPSENPINDYFDYYLGISELPEGVVDYVYFTSASTSVREAGVFKVADKKTADTLLAAFETRCENLASTFENYSPEDTAIAKGMKSGSFDNIVWFVAAPDSESIISAIEE